MFEKLTQYTSPKYRQQLLDHIRTPLYGNAYLLIINQGLSAILGFVYWTIAARFFTAQAVGRSSAIISTLILLSMLAELSLRSGMQRFVPRAGQQVKKLILLTYAVSLLATGLLTIGFFVIGGYLHITDSLFSGMRSTSLALFVLAAMLWTVFFIQDGILMGLRQAKWVLWENTLYNAGKIVLLIIGINGILGDGIVTSWFLPTTLTILIVNILVFSRFIPDFRQTDRPSAEPVKRHELITSIAGDHIGTILAETSTRLLPLLVVNLIGTTANAYFYQAWLIASMVYAVPVNIASSFTVEASSDLNRVGYYSQKTLRYMTLLILPMTLILVVLAPIILKIYGGAYSQQGTPVLRWLALASIPYALNAWYIAYARVKADVKAIIWNQGLQFVVVLGLSYWWMRSGGIASIGIAWLIAQVIAALIVFIVTRQVITREGKNEGAQSTFGQTPQEGHPVTPAHDLERVPVTGADAQPASDGEITNLFLSPHLDDAALSCGGLISRLTSNGERVVIVTMFTGDIPEDRQLSWLAKRNLRAWGIDTSTFRSAFQLRRREDEEAAEKLGAETIHLGFLDAMYRCGVDGLPYYQQNTVGVPINPEDEMFTGAALRTTFTHIASRYASPGKFRVFSPICAGQHIDHILVRCSAEAVFGRQKLTYYEDHPYAAHPRKHQQPYPPDHRNGKGQWVQNPVILTKKEIEARIDAIACYSSQIPGLFPSPFERMGEIMSIRVPVVGPFIWDRHWRTLNYEKSRERMAKSLNTYIERAGGENYWYFASSEE